VGNKPAAASAAALFEASSSAAFCLASASAAECNICGSEKKSYNCNNKVQANCNVGGVWVTNLLLPQLQPSLKLPHQQPSA
jgi:hypothetical protein